MSDLTASLAALAERLGARPAPPRVPEEVADRPSSPGMVDLSGILAMPLDQFAREADDEAGSAARLITALQTVAADVGMAATPTRLLEALQANGYAWVKSARRLAGLLAPLGLVARPGRENGRPVRLYTLDPGVLADLARRYNPAVGAAGEHESPSLSKPLESVDNRQQASTAP